MLLPEDIAKAGSESAHQQALMCWSALMRPQYHCLKWLYSIPNGGTRDKREAARLKAEGVRSGVWDLHLMYPCNGFHGMYIEMKVGTNVLSPDQIDFGNDAIALGYCCAVCYTWEQARDAILNYLGKGVSVL